VFLVCIAGPDLGKRLALTPGSMVFGRRSDANLLSDDPDVGDSYARLDFDGIQLQVTALTEATPFLDGHPVAAAVMRPGQQLRMGRSLWQLPAPGTASAQTVFDFVNRIGDHISHVAGVEKAGEWNPREMFSDVGKRHSDEEIEAYFTAGTASTTPPLAAIDTRWPKPWVFARVFGLTLLLYVGFVWAFNEFQNENLIPGLITIGSVAIPFSLLIFFFEVNVPRNISLYQVIKLLLVGGLASIVIALFGFKVTELDQTLLGASSAGIIEEIGKGLALLLVVNRPRFRWTLNGLLLGATVGTGFAVFESAGYALRAASDSLEAMRSNILERGLLSILGGHVLWTGLVGAALWRVRGDRPFRKEMLIDPRFLRVLLVCMAMHALWNADLGGENPGFITVYGKYIVLGAVAWMLVLGFIQDGLKQVRAAQQAGVAADRPLATPLTPAV
jgi:RsiW-degrading membrane proteinase PrsW (M82 family)